MNRYILILISLFTIMSCTDDSISDDDIFDLGRANLEMTFTSATGETEHLINNMRIFLFDEEYPNILRYEITNLVKNLSTSTVSTEDIPIGNWNMVAVSSLKAGEKLNFQNNLNTTTRQRLLYEFDAKSSSIPSGYTGADSPEIVTYFAYLRVKKDATTSADATFTRAVGKVSAAITVVNSREINQNSTKHTVEIINVPTSLSFEGALLDGSDVASRKEPETLDSKNNQLMKRPIVIETSDAVNNKSVFIIPAYFDGGADENNKNKRLIIKIRLEKTNGGFYEKQAEIPAPVIANKELYVKISIERDVEITIQTEVLGWTSTAVTIPSFD